MGLRNDHRSQGRSTELKPSGAGGDIRVCSARTGDEIAERIAPGSGMPMLMLTAADRVDDKATGIELRC